MLNGKAYQGMWQKNSIKSGFRILEFLKAVFDQFRARVKHLKINSAIVQTMVTLGLIHRKCGWQRLEQSSIHLNAGAKLSLVLLNQNIIIQIAGVKSCIKFQKIN